MGNKKETKYGVVNRVVLGMATRTLNQACAWIFHQPSVPKELEQYSKKGGK